MVNEEVGKLDLEVEKKKMIHFKKARSKGSQQTLNSDDDDGDDDEED